ncbi:MAG: NYN domain-containing protein [Acidobacteria bacterium]|nr:NYN domain-containing protein [Acidobacteriota bacterium]
MARRATLFIDGNNWYHGLKGLGSVDLGRLDYRRLSLKLVGPRHWIGTRYYIGRVPQSGDVTLYAGQRRFLAKLEAEPRISTHLGRLEPRPVANPTARELRSYLANLRTKIDFRVDGDFTPAVEHVRSRGKRVYGVSASSGARLAAAVNSSIRIREASWFADCYDASVAASDDG